MRSLTLRGVAGDVLPDSFPGGRVMTFARVVGLGAVLAWAVAAMPSQTFGQMAARRALDVPVKQLSVDGMSLERTLNYLRDASGANLVVNWKVLEQAGVAKDTTITLNVKELPLKKMMRLVLDQASPNAQLVFDVSDNVITVTTQEEADRHMVTKVYVVDDLLLQASNKQAPNLNLSLTVSGGNGAGGYGSGQGTGFGTGGGMGGTGTGRTGSIFDPPTGTGTGRTGSGTTGSGTGTTAQGPNTAKQQAGDDLAALIRDVVRPNIWKENGGTASVKYTMGKLIVTAPVSVQEAIGGPVEGGIRYGN